MPVVKCRIVKYGMQPKKVKKQAVLSMCRVLHGQPHRKTNKGQKGLSYLGPSLWNKLDTEHKLIANLNTFKHSLKDNFFNQLVKNKEDIYR